MTDVNRPSKVMESVYVQMPLNKCEVMNDSEWVQQVIYIMVPSLHEGLTLFCDTICKVSVLDCGTSFSNLLTFSQMARVGSN